MNSINSLAKGGIINIFFGIFGAGVMFLFNILAANYFGSENFGVFSLVQAIFMFSIMFASFGIVNSIMRYYSYYMEKDKSYLKGYVRFVFITNFFIALLVGIILFIFADLITKFFEFPSILTTFIQIIAFGVPFKIICKITNKIFISEKKYFHKSFSVEFFNKIFLLIGVFLIIFFELNIKYLIYVFVSSIIAQFIYNLLVFLLDKKNIIYSNIESKTDIKNWMYFSLPLFFTSFTGFIYSWSDKIIIGKFLSPSELGVYSVALSIAMFLFMFKGNLTNIFTPLISQNVGLGNYEEIKYLYVKSRNWILMATLPIFIVLIAFSKQILSLLYAQEYLAAYIPLSIIAFGLLFNIFLGLNQNILFAHGKSKLLFYNNLFVSVFNIVLNIILIPIIGIIGAAIATSLSYVIENIFYYFKARQLISLEFDLVNTFKVFSAGIISATLGYLVFRVLEIHLLFDLIISIGIYFGGYLILLILFKSFDKKDVEILQLIEKKIGFNKFSRIMRKLI